MTDTEIEKLVEKLEADLERLERRRERIQRKCSHTHTTLISYESSREGWEDEDDPSGNTIDVWEINTVKRKCNLCGYITVGRDSLVVSSYKQNEQRR